MSRFLLRAKGIAEIRLIIAGILVFSGGMMFSPGLGYANDTHSQFATIQLELEPQIAVNVESSTVHVSDPGTPGDFDVIIDFTVEANTTQVNMFVEATDFYFGGDPGDQLVEPIHLNESSGCEIDPEGADALNGNKAYFTGDGDTIDGYPSRKTETIAFQSNGVNHMFSHPVAVTVTWNLEPMKPAGQYTAKVRLTSIALPPGS
jgi:hypothetical protein